MAALQLTILKGIHQKSEPSTHSKVVTFQELKNWIIRGALLRHLFRYQEVQLLTYRLEVLPKPLLTAILLRLLSHNRCHIEDEQGQRQDITFTFFFRLLWKFMVDFWRRYSMMRRTRKEVDHLEAGEGKQVAERYTLDLSAQPLYLRTDSWYGVSAGGSVGHIAGVFNNLDQFGGKPILLTTDAIPTVRTDLEIHAILVGADFWDFKELPWFFINQVFEGNAIDLLGDKQLSFVYQRHSINNFSGIMLAQHYGVPFVLEYNGSEVWVSKHWGEPLKYEALSERIELLNLKAADVIVVVSKPIQDELLQRGIGGDKILVNPNGVNPDVYHPGVSGAAVRAEQDLKGKTVIGFIGSFGRWHGAEVLAETFGILLQENPAYREQVRLLLIGDGVTMPLVRANLAKHDVEAACILTGTIPQEEGPAHLAACDILVASHVPNPDGTPFFGSPTKLFEYMAVGKGIVASDLDQIGEVLEHDRTAWLVEPGDPEALKKGLKVLVEDAERRGRLGAAARDEVVAKYTWEMHVGRIIDKLKERFG